MLPPAVRLQVLQGQGLLAAAGYNQRAAVQQLVVLWAQQGAVTQLQRGRQDVKVALFVEQPDMRGCLIQEVNFTVVSCRACRFPV